MNEETIFHLAREKSPDERPAFLDAACAGDVALRKRLEVLLRADTAAGSFLARPALDAAASESPTPVADSATLVPGETAPSAPSPACRIRYFGDYELLEEIAQGGMGVVWRARQSNLKRDVALKMIRSGALATSAEVARFLREAEAAANLQHPNIVAIHEVGEHDGRHYFSMDLVDGRDLGAIAAEGPLAPQRAARYVKTIAEAIQFAHQRGTLHRDLKPQNILIDAADRPRITDFGLAKTTSDSQLTQSGIIMGSPSYMPPEQAGGRLGDIGPASDVYSLGAMLYELLTGRPPFRGETTMATLRDVMETEPAALRKVKAGIPPDLETICLKCLEKSPAARYPTAQALADELDRFLKGEPIHARPASAVRKAVSWGRRHPGTLSALAVLIIVTLAIGIFYLFEENAFLRAKQADPSLARVRGPLHDSLEIWSTIGALAMCVGIFSLIVLRGRARGLSFNKSLSMGWHERPLQPLDERTRNIAVGIGVVVTACGVMFLVKTIQAYVWEEEAIWAHLAIAYASIYWGLSILGIAVRDYRLVYYGAPSTPGKVLPEATAEQAAASRAASEKARAAMEKWDQQAAIKIYRDAGLTHRDAMLAAMNIGRKLQAEEPDRFAYPPLSPANLAWKGMSICLLIEAIVLAVVWHVNPPSYPIAAVLLFIYSYLIGVGCMAFLRVKGFGKRVLLLAPGLLIMLVSEMALHSLAGPWRTFLPYVLGYFSGIALMGCGLAGEAGRAMRKKLDGASN